MVGYKKYFFRVLFIVLILNFSFSYGQSEMDTLSNKSYDELFEIYNNESNIEKSDFYINIWIKKAKDENNLPQLFTGYEIASFLYKDDRALKYLDSILSISLEEKSYDSQSAAAYKMKGEYFYIKRDFKRELENYILAKKYANNSGHIILGCLLEYNIGLVKNRLGEHSEALEIHKNNYPLIKKHLKGKANYSYLHSIYAIANSYNYLRKLDSAEYYNNLGVKESLKLNDNENINFFTLNQGVTHYYLKQYNSSIDSLTKVSEYFKAKKDSPNASESFYFLGKSYEKIKKFTLAKKYFKKVDSIFRQTNDLLPVLRGTYQYLIDVSEKNNNLKDQIDYTKQLIKLDSILYTNEIYINKNIIKNYDIPKLISKKEVILQKMKEKDSLFQTTLILVSTVICILIIFLINQNKKRKLYKIRFEEILNTNSNSNSNSNSNKKKIDIPDEIIDNVLKALSSFEKKQLFIKNITLNALAKEFETNSNYLSKIINQYKNTSFSNYLSTLRIEYIINKLKTDATLRKFKIKAIAKEAGFNNSESFSKAFEKINGIKPSYFLRELDKFNTKN